MSGSETDAQTLRRLMARRFSCRAFRPDPVPDATIEAIVETARLTPSWCNVQPWDLVVTRLGVTKPFAEALMREALGGGGEPDIPFPAAYTGVRLERRRASGFGLYGALGIARDDHAARRRQMLENFRFFGAPHVAILSCPAELGAYGGVDCGAFVAAFLLAAEAEGVATIAQAALAQYSGFIRRYFGIPDERRVVCGISFGYADPEHPANRFRTERAAAGEVFRFA